MQNNMLPETKEKEIINRYNAELCFNMALSKHAAQMTVDIILSSLVEKEGPDFEFWYNVQKFLKDF
jgi:hypothetical protein